MRSWLFSPFLLVPSLLVAAPAPAADLPLGDGKVTTDGPRAGYVFVCTTAPFSQGRGAPGPGTPGPGTQERGPWIHGDRFDPAAKPVVEGHVTWPDAMLSIAATATARLIVSNDLPSTPTGEFPIKPGSEAFRYDRNPNAIQSQHVEWSLPLDPAAAPAPTCLPPGGPIGLLLDGSYLFNALDAEGRDAAAHEIQDRCAGHPEMRGAYHHHALSPCMDLGDPKGTSPLIGYALDGYGVYGPYQEGRRVTNADLDSCHGTTSRVVWNGATRTVYHYVGTFEYPYTLGCYHGTPAVRGASPRARPGPRPSPGPGPRPFTPPR